MRENADEELLGGGWRTEVRGVGNTVLRAPGPHSPTVIRLLHHLAESGFEAAPRPIGSGFAPDGREHLTFLEGASWQPWFGRKLPGSFPVIGHGDLGPWNILARDAVPVAFIDWDTAGPLDAIWELAQVVWLNAQLHDDDVAELNELPGIEERLLHAAAILDGYELASDMRIGFVDKMIEFAIRSARDEAVTHAVAPETPSPAADGFPILWGVTWRARAASWMLDHRIAIERALS